MARKKKPLNESETEAKMRQELEAVSNVASRSEKRAWNRKRNNMNNHLALLNPIEDKILELQAQKEPIFDEIQILRAIMVEECVHPYDYLIHTGSYIKCKFCNRRLRLSKDPNPDTNHDSTKNKT
jgi:hypothetical protein